MKACCPIALACPEAMVDHNLMNNAVLHGLFLHGVQRHMHAQSPACAVSQTAPHVHNCDACAHTQQSNGATSLRAFQLYQLRTDSKDVCGNTIVCIFNSINTKPAQTNWL